MSYSIASQVRLVMTGWVDISVEDPDITPAQLTDAQIEYEISNADEQINSVLRRIYALPLPAPTPVVLTNLSIDIAAALCDIDFRGSREYASDLSPARLRYQRALMILDHIANGDYPLYNPGEGPTPVGDESIVINPYPGDILLTREVFPRGYPDGGIGNDRAELASTEFIPYYPYLSGG